MRNFFLLSLFAATAGQQIRADHLPHVTASYTLTPQGKMRIGKRNNAVLRRYYDVVAMERDVVALRPKLLAASANASWEEDLAAARRDPC